MYKELPIFVVNMQKDKNRREHISKELNQYKLVFEFVEAVDGNQLDDQHINRITQKQKTIDTMGRQMSKSEIGCAMSHLHIYQKMLEQNIQQAIIFEDDIYIYDFANFVQIIDFLAKTNSDKAQVYLLTKVISYLSKDTRKINDTYSVAHCIQGKRTSGYVVNQQAAKQILDINTQIWTVADDWERFRMTTDVDIACIVPHIVWQKTSIADYSTISMGIKKNRTIKYIASRNKNKLIADIKKYFYYIPFKGYVRLK